MTTEQTTQPYVSHQYRVALAGFPATLEALRGHYERSKGVRVTKGEAIALAVSEALRRAERAGK